MTNAIKKCSKVSKQRKLYGSLNMFTVYKLMFKISSESSMKRKKGTGKMKSSMTGKRGGEKCKKFQIQKSSKQKI